MKVFSLSDYEQEISPQLLPEWRGDAIDYLIYGVKTSGKAGGLIWPYKGLIPAASEDAGMA